MGGEGGVTTVAVRGLYFAAAEVSDEDAVITTE